MSPSERLINRREKYLIHCWTNSIRDSLGKRHALQATKCVSSRCIGCLGERPPDLTLCPNRLQKLFEANRPGRNSISPCFIASQVLTSAALIAARGLLRNAGCRQRLNRRL